MVYRSFLIPIGIFFTALVHAKIDVPEGYQQMAQSHSIPPEILYSVAMTESNYKLPDGSYRPWPWTINVAGTGYRYDSRQEAYDALIQFMKEHPLKRIDVGIAQVNLGWNGHYFRTYWDAFEPYTNLNAASQILKYCFDNSSANSWLNAAGCYHHPAGGKHAERYKTVVQNNLQQLDIPTGLGIKTSSVQQSLDEAVSQHNLSANNQLAEEYEKEANLVFDLSSLFIAEQIGQFEIAFGIDNETIQDQSTEFEEPELYVNDPTFEINIANDIPANIAAPDDDSIWIEPEDKLDTQLVWVNPKN